MFINDYQDPDPNHTALDLLGYDNIVRASGHGVVHSSDPCSADQCVNMSGYTGADYNAGAGNVVIIEYAYGDLPDYAIERAGLTEGQSLFFMYSHLAEPSSLQPHDTVDAGDIIGLVGSTGNSDQTHLHLTVVAAYPDELGYGSFVASQGEAKPDLFEQWRQIRVNTINPRLLFPTIRNRR